MKQCRSGYTHNYINEIT